MLKLRGVLCPIATPFNHRGELYVTKIRHNLGRLGLTKVSGIIVGSTWGEGPLLGEADLFKLWSEAKAGAVGDVQLIASAGAESVSETLGRCRLAQEAGFSAVWVAPHRTFGPDPGLQLLYFRSIADRSPLPVIVGEVDKTVLPTSEIEKLAAHPNIAAICSRDEPLTHLKALIGTDGCGALSSQLAGISAALAGGIKAAVLPLANVLPFHLISIEEAIRTRENEAAADLESRLGAIDALLLRHGVAGLKHAMDLRGYFGGDPRLPLKRVNPSVQAAIEEALEGLSS
ncbi:MAG: dihydrodipicolinate synthase family protein [Acidobacteria bacterium]|nr:dihydrodipicolinate synthase family protein [Acidobacteriota bacterium]MDA1234366.1 dihydrodipicolinate synthase family protein [Acidobacteriota bacterium]